MSAQRSLTQLTSRRLSVAFSYAKSDPGHRKAPRQLLAKDAARKTILAVYEAYDVARRQSFTVRQMAKFCNKALAML